MRTIFSYLKYLFVFVIISLVGLCIYFLFITIINADAKEYGTIITDSSYAFDESTVLDRLQNEEDNIFRLIDNPDEETIESPTTNNWTQADFFAIAQAVYKSTKEQSLDGWFLNEIDFSTDCINGSKKLESAKLYYFKTNAGTTTSRNNITFFIHSTQGKVDIWETISTPDLENLQPLDISKLNFTAEEIIQISESHGGSEKRKKMNNECYISTRIKGGGTYYKGFAYNGWVTSYHMPVINPDPFLEFYIKIDPMNGEYKIIDPGKGYPNFWQILFPPAPE